MAFPAHKELVEAILYMAFFLVIVAMAFLYFFQSSRQKMMNKELERQGLEMQHQKQLLHAVLQTQEEERRRIARDLHDDISSKLNIVTLNSHLLASPKLRAEQREKILSTITGVTKIAIDNAERIAHALLPATLEKFGLDVAITELCAEFGTLDEVKISYANALSFDHLENMTSLNIFRIVQELVANSVKHARPHLISLVFERHDSQNRCVFTDDGCGFDPSGIERKGRLGLGNIKSRVEMIGGALSLNSEPGKGIEVIFTF